MKPPISRREFMRDAAIATAAWQIAAPSFANECVAPPQSSAAGQSRRYDVLVIGAGTSGLAAAGALAAGDKSVIVLKARDRIGGRVWTNRTWPDLPVDLGTSWIHGRQGNPLTELAARKLFWPLGDNLDHGFMQPAHDLFRLKMLLGDREILRNPKTIKSHTLRSLPWAFYDSDYEKVSRMD